MQWKKDPNLKYTDLCIYIDENMEKLRNPGEYPDVENKIWNYLWLLIKALAIKKGMFDDFQHYDPYAFYGANRIFFALRKNLQNEGKTIIKLNIGNLGTKKTKYKSPQAINVQFAPCQIPVNSHTTNKLKKLCVLLPVLFPPNGIYT